MEISGIQIAVTIFVILGAAGIALICDYLRAKNEALREAMLELKAYKETTAAPAAQHSAHRELGPRLVKPAAVKPVQNIEAVTTPGTANVEQATATVIAKLAAKNQRNSGRSNLRGSASDPIDLVRKSSAPARAAQQRFDAMVPPRKKQMVAKHEPKPEKLELEPVEITSVLGHAKPQSEIAGTFAKSEQMNSQDSLAEWLSRRAAARAAQVPERKSEIVAAKPEPKVTAAPVSVEPAAPILTVEPVEAAPVPVAAEPPAAKIEIPSAPRTHEYPEVAIDASLWESLLSGKSIPVAPAITITAAEHKLERTSSAPEAQFQLIRGSSSSSNELLVPAGMHEKSDLTRLLQSNKPFTGLVVSIGVSENDGRSPRNEDTMRATSLYISGLLRENDFGCRAADDEFLMICPGEEGAEAQRRLSQIAERLWDFQLREIGTYSILFSWGGIDVHTEPLSEAISSASERMHQTKRSRKTVSMDSVSHRRKAAM